MSVKHGESRYRSHKCRCGVCKAAKAKAQAGYRLTVVYKESQARGRATPQGKKALARRNAEYYATEDGMKRCKARSAVNKAISKGTLIKQPCRVCGETKVQAHHPDYNRPLLVWWMCRKHHKELHRKN